MMDKVTFNRVNPAQFAGKPAAPTLNEKIATAFEQLRKDFDRRTPEFGRFDDYEMVIDNPNPAKGEPAQVILRVGGFRLTPGQKHRRFLGVKVVNADGGDNERWIYNGSKAYLQKKLDEEGTLAEIYRAVDAGLAALGA